MMNKIFWVAGVVAVLISISVALAWPKKIVDVPLRGTPQPSATPLPTAAALTRSLEAQSIAGVATEYTFTASIPADWQAEAVPAIEAINIYDPAAVGSTNLEKSQIFIRHFSGNNFLTLGTVNIIEREALTIAGRPAVRYLIEKKASVADFANQPAWRNVRHVVTDIRVADTSPSVFYVIAQRPDLSAIVYQEFLHSLQASSTNTLLFEPTTDFLARITKKTFGLFITPSTSPVQPERFAGYHTGVDAEYGDIKEPVKVRAVAGGEVVVARTAEGYGGVAVLRHQINRQDRLIVYGHLDPNSLPAVGTNITPRQAIGTLGEGGTPATDGERKHLHLAVLTQNKLDLRGYVPTKEELTSWIDPKLLFQP